MDRTVTLATIGDFTFLQGTWSDGSPVYSFLIGDTNGRPHEWYASLDMALIAAVGEKYTGPRGAGGPNVGTAADWFAKMIGLDGHCTEHGQVR